MQNREQQLKTTCFDLLQSIQRCFENVLFLLLQIFISIQQVYTYSTLVYMH